MDQPLHDDPVIEARANARRELLASARQRIYVDGWAQVEWETDPDVVALAKAHGISDRELDAMAWLGSSRRFRHR